MIPNAETADAIADRADNIVRAPIASQLLFAFLKAPVTNGFTGFTSGRDVVLNCVPTIVRFEEKLDASGPLSSDLNPGF